MATLRRKRSADELGKLVADKRMELREHRRAHRGWFRETLHEQVDARVREAAERFEALLAHVNGADGVPPLQATALGRHGLLDLAALWHLARDTELHARLHAHVDALPAEHFPKLSRAEAEARDDKLAAELLQLENELREAERQAAHEALDRELAAAGGP